MARRRSMQLIRLPTHMYMHAHTHTHKSTNITKNGIWNNKNICNTIFRLATKPQMAMAGD